MRTPATAQRIFVAQLLAEPVAAQAKTGHWTDNAKQAFTQHWPEYLIEGRRTGAVHGFRLRLLGAAGASRFADARQRLEPARAPLPERSRDGTDRRSADFFSEGKAVRRAHESSIHADVLLVGQDRPVGRTLLLFVASSWADSGGVLFSFTVIGAPLDHLQ